MPFGWGIVSTGKHPDVKIAPAMAAADGGELVGVYSRDQHRAEAFAQKHDARAYSDHVRWLAFARSSSAAKFDTDMISLSIGLSSRTSCPPFWCSKMRTSA